MSSGVKKPTRRYHKKSRNGCAQCRSRRIKCDETHPACRNCQRASKDCHYAAQSSPSTRSTPSNSIPQLLPPAATESSPSFDLLDLSLMHHYATVTSVSLFGEEQKELWQTEIPIMARSSPLLMHGLLATAALHMAFLHKDSPVAFTNRALHHHSLGLELFNGEIATLSAENSKSPVLFTFGLFLVIWAYASPTIPSAINTPTDEFELDTLLSSLDLVRGNKVIFELSSEMILSQPIGRFTRPSADNLARPRLNSQTLPKPIQDTLDDLRKHVTDFIESMAIDQLEQYLLDTVSNPDDMRRPLGWPALAESPFWERVRKYKPTALLIFLHYAVLLAYYELRAWWMEGWSDRLVGAVNQVLDKQDKNRPDWDTCVRKVSAVVMNVKESIRYPLSASSHLRSQLCPAR
ncbi:Zn(II)2Cys6 transcription factor [Aspergillus mulundensis]|uniref:Putative Zn(II)2Cys6 transcription factor n=1 Tax=Aspergillus mulundensis TaxID=1810919 RepID=A0A3D8R4S5_9EURO|nr:putative Zn(II)2Cys6 transcription factor [Aspergillus mulundensis]RDW68968.1 putative Zn(II)2Cys6 transcription factor [Aspergillus mulundensis]